MQGASNSWELLGRAVTGWDKMGEHRAVDSLMVKPGCHVFPSFLLCSVAGLFLQGKLVPLSATLRFPSPTRFRLRIVM